jgi:hypothetical protein
MPPDPARSHPPGVPTTEPGPISDLYPDRCDGCGGGPCGDYTHALLYAPVITLPPDRHPPIARDLRPPGVPTTEPAPDRPRPDDFESVAEDAITLCEIIDAKAPRPAGGACMSGPHKAVTDALRHRLDDLRVPRAADYHLGPIPVALRSSVPNEFGGVDETFDYRAPSLPADLHRRLDAAGIVRCGDGSCIFGRPAGMHTNGGCRCIERGTTTPEVKQLVRQMAGVLRQYAEERADLARLLVEFSEAWDFDASSLADPNKALLRVNRSSSALAEWTRTHLGGK